ncbi:hypothetical protein E4U42_007385 [Claviceps africana]|uniref:Uncharacterized protein n=1 Tax=Claviceps africana TaxID=83212 RepID=A0A8K0J1F1_9HYPO|nr:hypothetical protein E4U42_007385 [Claviceps africana]
MSLTPVRVRGKRKTSSSIIPNLAMDNPWHHKKVKRSLASVRASRSSRHRPSLQSLPVELLESILLYSANLALPRSSPLLGAKLSGKATLLRLFIVVFHDTWDQCFGIPRGELQADKEKLFARCEGDVSFQSDMLEMPWVDIDFILQAQQAWADRYARDRCYQHSLPFADGLDKLHHYAHRHGEGSPYFHSRDCFEADYEQAVKWPALVTTSITSTAWGTQDVHPLVRIPTDLVTGPWDEEKKRRLFWLIRGGVRLGVEGRTCIPWEVKLACLDAAVVSAEEPDALVINCLIGDWIFRELPEDAARRQLVDLRRRIEWGGDPPETKEILRRVATALNLDLQLPEYYRLPG